MRRVPQSNGSPPATRSPGPPASNRRTVGEQKSARFALDLKDTTPSSPSDPQRTKSKPVISRSPSNTKSGRKSLKSSPLDANSSYTTGTTNTTTEYDDSLFQLDPLGIDPKNPQRSKCCKCNSCPWRIPLVCVLQIILLGVTCAAGVYIKLWFTPIPTTFYAWAQWSIFVGNPIGIAVCSLALFILFRHPDVFSFQEDEINVRRKRLGVSFFHVLILIVVGVNGFTSFALIYVNKAAIVDYTISYSRSYQQWPPYLPLTNQLTSCSGAARYNTNAASLNQGIINNCSGHFLLILRQPSSVKRLVRNAVENNPKFMAVDARDEKVDDDMWIIYQIYGSVFGLMVFAIASAGLFLMCLIAFDIYLCKHSRPPNDIYPDPDEIQFFSDIMEEYHADGRDSMSAFRTSQIDLGAEYMQPDLWRQQQQQQQQQQEETLQQYLSTKQQLRPGAPQMQKNPWQQPGQDPNRPPWQQQGPGVPNMPPWQQQGPGAQNMPPYWQQPGLGPNMQPNPWQQPGLDPNMQPNPWQQQGPGAQIMPPWQQPGPAQNLQPNPFQQPDVLGSPQQPGQVNIIMQMSPNEPAGKGVENPEPQPPVSDAEPAKQPVAPTAEADPSNQPETAYVAPILNPVPTPTNPDSTDKLTLRRDDPSLEPTMYNAEKRKVAIFERDDQQAQAQVDEDEDQGRRPGRKRKGKKRKKEKKKRKKNKKHHHHDRER